MVYDFGNEMANIWNILENYGHRFLIVDLDNYNPKEAWLNMLA